MLVGTQYKGFRVTRVNADEYGYSGEAEYTPKGEVIKFFSKDFNDLESAFRDACEEYLDYAAYQAYANDMAEYLGRRYHIDGFNPWDEEWDEEWGDNSGFDF